MHTELFRGIGPIQILAIFLHAGILVIIQQLLDRLAKMLRVDRLSLINDPSTRTAVVRALLTRFDLWIWACGIYTLAAWLLSTLLDPLLGAGWATPARQISMLKVISVLAISSLVGRLIYVSNRRLRALAAGDSSHWESVVAVLCAGEISGAPGKDQNSRPIRPACTGGPRTAFADSELCRQRERFSKGINITCRS
jgi:hypothetical protein